MSQLSPCRSCNGTSIRVLSVFGADDLNLLKPWARRFDSVQVRWMGRSHEENQAIQDALEREYLECGCRSGRVALVLILLILGLVFLFGGTSVRRWSPESWVIFVSVAVIVPMLAKLISLVSARLRLAELIRTLQTAATSDEGRLFLARGHRRNC